MLFKFAVENYKSFKGKATLDMVSSSKIRTMGNHVIHSGGKKILRNAAIYGANAAGKSNLFDALALVQSAVRFGHLYRSVSIEYCKLIDGGKDVPSSFDILFEKNGTYFDYGFSALLSDQRVVEEWLYASKNRSETNLQLVFSWSGAKQFEIGDLLKNQLDTKNSSRFDIYIEDFASLDEDSLFISFMNRGKQLSESSALSLFDDAYSFLVSSLSRIEADVPRPQHMDYSEESELDRIADLLKTFDTGISSITSRNVKFEELADFVPVRILETIRKDIDELSAGEKGVFNLRSKNSFVTIRAEKGVEPAASVLVIQHEGSFYDYDFAEESDGTKRLFDYLDILLDRNKNTVYFVDELDRSLHPMLTRQLISLFNEYHSEDDDHCQLIFTTHEDALLDGGVLRNDEVWFIDRDENGCSTLTPLDRFKERSDASVGKAYLAGRYGGIPILAPLFASEKPPREEVG